MAQGRLALLAAALAVAASVGCGRSTPDTPEARRERGFELVDDAGGVVASAHTVSFLAREQGERVKRSGRKVAVSIDHRVQVRRPDRMHLEESGDHDLEVFYAGDGVTLISDREKVYGFIPAKGNLTDVINDELHRYDIPFPLGDLIAFTSAERLVNEDTQGGWVAEEAIDGRPVHKVAWQHPNLDWTVWVAAEGQPLPVRLELIYKGRRGTPRRVYDFTDWQFGTELADSLFVANVPDDYEGIPVIQRVSAVLTDKELAAGGGEK